jgi:excisionase family DNA binding protein
MQPKKVVLPPNLAPVGLRLEQAAEYVGVSPNNFMKMVRQGVMPQPRCFGARRIWIRTELDVALASLPTPDGATARYAPAPDDGPSDLDRLLGV